jgi:hypothetical protein
MDTLSAGVKRFVRDKEKAVLIQLGKIKGENKEVQYEQQPPVSLK